MDNTDNDQQIITSWIKNANPWTTAVREKQIESRRLVTDQAIIDAVASIKPNTVLDIGCGEGWLVRALSQQNISVLGIDVVPGLVKKAQQAGGGRFQSLSYADIAKGALTEKFDVVIGNFSLLGKTSVNELFKVMPALLNDGGYFIVQTLHPVITCRDQPYEDGWRNGSWEGFNPTFSDPAPWYFRTLDSWLRLFHENGLQIEEIREPSNPETGNVVSIIFMAHLAN